MDIIIRSKKTSDKTKRKHSLKKIGGCFFDTEQERKGAVGKCKAKRLNKDVKTARRVKKLQETKQKSSAGIIWSYVKRHLGIFILGLVCSMCHTLFNMMTPQIIRMTVDSVITEQKLPDWIADLSIGGWIGQSVQRMLLFSAGAVVAAAALGGIFNFFAKLNTSRAAESTIKELRDNLYSHIQKLPFSWHTSHQTGEIIQRCTSDVEVIRTFISQQMVEVFRISFMLIMTMVIMFSMNVKISLVAIAFIPLIFFHSFFFRKKISKRFQEADIMEGELSSVTQENLTGVRVVRACGRENFEIDRFDEKNEAYSELWIKLGKMMTAFWTTSDFTCAMQIMVVMCVGAYSAVHGEITLGEFLALIAYNATLSWPIRALGRIISEMSKAAVSVERLRYILESQPEQDAPQVVEPPMDRDIVFDHVTFSYEDQKPVLDDVSFTIPAGKTFAVLGGTGSGKTTLMHLMNRLYEIEDGKGKITIGGVDIKDISLAYLRKNISIVLQEPFLFSRTIQENIGIACREIDPSRKFDAVQEAAREACIDESIQNFKNGYDTVVGERGVTLSGGQKQRVAIARMLMQQASIMIFDDSLSAVDAETDAKIRAALRERLGAATVILISHRVTTLMQADQILVLEHGRVADMGTHAELIGRPGIYQDIYNIQMQSDDRKLIAEGGAD